MTLDDVLDYCWITFVMTDDVLDDVLDDVGCFGWRCMTFSMTLNFGYVLVDVRWSFGWRMTFWMTLYDDMDYVVWRFGWRWMTLDDVLDDVGWRMTLNDFGCRFRRRSMTFWMKLDDILDDVRWRWLTLGDVFDDPWMTFWMTLDDILDDVGCHFGWRWMMMDDVLIDVGWCFGWRMTFWMMVDDVVDEVGLRFG